MVLVTNGYNTKEFDTKIQANKHIAEDVSKHGIASELIYHHTDGEIEVLVYQYSTLYLETYIIHTKFDLRK